MFTGTKATYDNNNKIFKSIGEITFDTVEGYKIISSNITINNTQSSITTENKAIITDLENNQIFLDNFEYLRKKTFLSL